ncbi:MAG: hypothetical protein P0Y52_12630 [Candidatus Brevundimonas phytovorans]|nr:Gfo/Idh/MocA family oxidoreductase [Brevundimonas sp.]WEK57378.1 MAG: hypothetical protein P0Y52_12630 [Brevundimonas sp.]
MTLRLGVIGFSEGNGHPFSFSAIVNGYDDVAFADCGWDGIHAYLKKRPPEAFGFADVRVSACWMPDPEMAIALARACKIEAVCDAPSAMYGMVDAVLILRDDAESHLPLARMFLDTGLPVFVDKPLCLDHETLAAFEPYLRSGQLMSCAGLRYAGELDAWRAAPRQFGDIKLIRGAVVVDWPRYGIHMLEAAMGALPGMIQPVAIRRHEADHDSLAIRLASGGIFLIDALGLAAKAFRLDVFGSETHGAVDMSDNFTAFHRVLAAFIEQVRTGRPAIPPEETLLVIRTIIAGLQAQPGGPEIDIVPSGAIAPSAK